MSKREERKRKRKKKRKRKRKRKRIDDWLAGEGGKRKSQRTGYLSSVVLSD